MSESRRCGVFAHRSDHARSPTSWVWLRTRWPRRDADRVGRLTKFPMDASGSGRPRQHGRRRPRSIRRRRAGSGTRSRTRPCRTAVHRGVGQESQNAALAAASAALSSMISRTTVRTVHSTARIHRFTAVTTSLSWPVGSRTGVHAGGRHRCTSEAAKHLLVRKRTR